MIKKYAINKFVIATLCLVLFMIFYFFPTTENIKPEVIKENKSNYENVVYLIDNDNYVSRVICYYDKLSIVEDIKKKIDLITNYDLDGFYTIELYAETNKPNIVIDKILKELKSKSISSEDLERYKKVKISYLVMESDNIETSVENAMDDLIVFGKVFDDEVDFIRGMNIDKFNEVMSKVDFSNHATVVLK